MANAFAAVRDARDAAVRLLAGCRSRRPQGARLRARPCRPPGHRAAGYGDYIIHRTGHSLGENVHGNGAHLDDYETHDERRLMPGTGFTIEPGIYFDRFRRTDRNQRGLEREGTRSHRRSPAGHPRVALIPGTRKYRACCVPPESP